MEHSLNKSNASSYTEEYLALCIKNTLNLINNDDELEIDIPENSSMTVTDEPEIRNDDEENLRLSVEDVCDLRTIDDVLEITVVTDNELGISISGNPNATIRDENEAKSNVKEVPGLSKEDTSDRTNNYEMLNIPVLTYNELEINIPGNPNATVRDENNIKSELEENPGLSMEATSNFINNDDVLDITVVTDNEIGIHIPENSNMIVTDKTKPTNNLKEHPELTVEDTFDLINNDGVFKIPVVTYNELQTNILGNPNTTVRDENEARSDVEEDPELLIEDTSDLLNHDDVFNISVVTDNEQGINIPRNSNMTVTDETEARSDVEENPRLSMEDAFDLATNDNVFEVNMDIDYEHSDERLDTRVAENLGIVDEYNRRIKDIGKFIEEIKPLQILDTLVNNLPKENNEQEETVKDLENAKQKFNDLIEILDNFKLENEQKMYRQIWKLKRLNMKGNSKIAKLLKTVDEQNFEIERLSDELAEERNEKLDVENKLAEAENNVEKSLMELSLATERETTLSILVAEKEKELEQSHESMKMVLEQLEQKNETYELKMKLTEAETNAETAMNELRLMTEKETQMSLLAVKRQKEADQANELVDTLITQLEEDSKSGMSKFMKLVESELECSICSELFVCPTTLNCAHTFCKRCLYEWKASGTNNCPICRNRITSEQRGLVLESFINKLVQNFPEDAKKKRQELLEQRNNRRVR